MKLFSARMLAIQAAMKQRISPIPFKAEEHQKRSLVHSARLFLWIIKITNLIGIEEENNVIVLIQKPWKILSLWLFTCTFAFLSILTNYISIPKEHLIFISKVYTVKKFANIFVYIFNSILLFLNRKTIVLLTNKLIKMCYYSPRINVINSEKVYRYFLIFEVFDYLSIYNSNVISYASEIFKAGKREGAEPRYTLSKRTGCAGQVRALAWPYSRTRCKLFTRTISSQFWLPSSSEPIQDTVLKLNTCNYIMHLEKSTKFQ